MSDASIATPSAAAGVPAARARTRDMHFRWPVHLELTVRRWDRTLRLPIGLLFVFHALASTQPQQTYTTSPFLLYSTLVLLAAMVVPFSGQFVRLLWATLGLLGLVLMLLMPSALGVPVDPALLLAAALPLDGLVSSALLAFGVCTLLFQVGVVPEMATWALAAWGLAAAGALYQHILAERRLVVAVLRDATQAIAQDGGSDDHIVLDLVRRVTGSSRVALLRDVSPHQRGAAVECPFVWLDGTKTKVDTAFVAPGFVVLPEHSNWSDMRVMDLPGKAPGKLYLSDKGTVDKEMASVAAGLVALYEQNRWLWERVHLADYSALESLSQALDARDPYTRGHSERVAAYSVAIGKELGIEPELLEELERGGMLHDIGKIGVPEAILKKPSRLTKEEVEIMRSHVPVGAEIIDAINSSKNVLDIVCCHHEDHNGTGYPRGLIGDHIPPLARIVHVADSFEAMTSARSYQTPKTLDEAIDELRRCSGQAFDPDVVDAFIAVLRREGHFLMTGSHRSRMSA
jgi:putative nucleotidyltransferase with HDIG domain